MATRKRRWQVVGPKVTLGFGLLGAGLSIVGALKPWAAVVGGVLAGVAAIWQYVIVGPAVYTFEESDWVATPTKGLHLRFADHGKGRTPLVRVELRNDDGYEEFFTDVHLEDSGAVLLGVAERCARRVTIS